MIIHALERTIVSGDCEYPIYIGFVKAEDLLNNAEVPNFKNDTPNSDIASNVLTPPVQQWQRPLIKENKERITKTFNGTGEFMPNPVLVAERVVGGKPNITIEDLKASGGISTDIKEIKISRGNDEGKAPLWIIDGQHRITGLGDKACIQRDNPIPVVLLLNNGKRFYDGRNLAKIFAQVTTEATPLSPLHKEWLTFSFNLDSYSKGNSPSKSMETVALLCKSPCFEVDGRINRFHDDIRFNDALSSSSEFLGQQYDCKDMSSIINKYYYSESSSYGHFQPNELAHQISIAFDVLSEIVKAPQGKTVFFGKGNYFHKIMCDAYLIGILTHLLQCDSLPNREDWDDLLRDLQFDKTDWNFQQHVKKSSRWVDKSKKLAFDIFIEIFSQGSLPHGVNNIWDYLSGDQLKLELEFKNLNDQGRPIKKDVSKVSLQRGSKKTIPMETRRYFKVCSRSKNAKHIEVFDERGNQAYPMTYKASGQVIEPDNSGDSLESIGIIFKVTLYGGAEESINITLSSWDSSD